MVAAVLAVVVVAAVVNVADAAGDVVVVVEVTMVKLQSDLKKWENAAPGVQVVAGRP